MNRCHTIYIPFISSALLVVTTVGLLSPVFITRSAWAQDSGEDTLDNSSEGSPDAVGEGQALGENAGDAASSGKPNPVGCLGGVAGAAGTVGGWFTGGFAVTDLGNLGSQLFSCIQVALGSIGSTVTASGIGYLVAKDKLNVLMTALLKKAINVARDMVIRWILTGRFEGPAFSASFAIDARRSAENAARIFLSKLTRIDFCAPFPAVPPRAFFSADLELSLACTFDKNDYEQFLLGNIGDFTHFWSSEETANDFWNVQVAILDRKLIEEQLALNAFAAEYAAGQGFLGIRKDGRIVTPGSYVAKTLFESDIVSPIRQTDVADTAQAAIAEIIDTAIRVAVEKGLSQARLKR